MDEAIDQNEEQELANIENRLGIEESNDGNGVYSLSFSFSYNPDDYESDIAPNPELEDKVDVVDVGAVANDAAVSEQATSGSVSASASQCAATFAQCKAKNPYACPYHGQQLLVGDMNAELAKVGIANANVTVVQNGKPGSFIMSVGGLRTLKDRRAAATAIDAFLKRGGISQKGAKNLGYKLTQKASMAKFSVADDPGNAMPNSQQKQPAANVGSLHPPARPPEPPKWTGLSDDDFNFLDKVGLDLAFLAQRVNHNLNKQPPSPGAGTMAAQNFAAIDLSRLQKLANDDSTGQAKRILDVYDEAKKSEQNGWNDKILAAKYDESKYNSSDPKSSTDFSSWGFDRTKCPTDPYAAARKAYNEWVPPTKSRTDALTSMGNAIKSASAKDRPGLDSLLKDATDASEEMSSYEDNASILDDAIANENDPDAKSELQELLKDLDAAYFDAKTRYDDAAGRLKKWTSSQKMMAEGDDCAAIAAKLSSSGKYVPPLLQKADATLVTRGEEAEKHLTSEIKAAGGIQNAKSNFAKNIRAFWNDDEIDLVINMPKDALTDIVGSNERYESKRGLDSDYMRLGKYNFDADYQNVREQHKYGGLFRKGSDGCTAYGSCTVVFDKSKVVGFIGGPHSCTRGTGHNGKCAVLPSNPDHLSYYWTGDAVAKDLSVGSHPGLDMLSNFESHTGEVPEFWFAGDVTRDMIKEIRTQDASDIKALRSDKNAVSHIKAAGIVVKLNGSVVNL